MKKTFAVSAISQVVLLAIASNAMANTPANDTAVLDEITVSGGSMYRMGEVPVHQAKSAVALSSEELGKQGVTKLDEIGLYQAGFTNQAFGNDNNTDWFRVRGTDVTRAIDGKVMVENGYFTPRANVFGLEAIEVTKGADSLAFGGSNAGGLLNYVSKRPHAEKVGQGEVKTELGHPTTYGIGADYTGAFNSKQSARYRLIAQYRSSEGEWKGTKNATYYLAPSVEFDLSDNTRLTFLSSFQRDKGVPSSQFLPLVGSLQPTSEGYINRSTNLGDKDNDTETNTQYSFGYELSHNFVHGLRLDSSYRYSFMDNYHRGSYYSWGGTEAPFQYNRGFALNDGIARSHNTDNRLSHTFNSAQLKNTFVFGSDYRYQTTQGKYGFGSVVGTTYLFNPTAGFQDQSTIGDGLYKARQLGFYLQDNITIADRIALTAGLRHDRVRQSANGNKEARENHTSYSGSAMYLSQIGLNPYYAYSESFTVPNGLNGNDELYKPSITKQHEIGIKYLPDWLDGAFSVAYFYAKDQGQLVAAPGGSVQADLSKRHGVEVQLDANVTKNLSATVAYTYQRSEKKAATSSEFTRNPQIPQNSVSAFVAYKFDQSVLQGLTLGAGVRHIGTSVYTQYKIPSATVADLMANYTFNKNWVGQLNVQNVGNRRFVASCDWFCYYGAGRNVNASVSYKF